jgi:phosphoglycolate phosphatase-like HAD superfamily hydrolase
VAPVAAILDVDGTLVDTNYHHAVAWYRAFREHGLVLPVWRIHRHIGMGGDQLVAALAGEEWDSEHGDAVREAEGERYGELIGEVAPLEGARELADDWTTSADVERTKPEPDLVSAAVEKAGGGEAVMVGDSTWDCEAAQRAGLETVGVLTGGFSDRELLQAGAARVFGSLPELLERLGETPLR